MTLILDEGVGDVSGLLDAVLDEMRPWAETNGLSMLTNAFVVGGEKDTVAVQADLLLARGLPDGWECMGAITGRDRRFLIARTNEAHWVLLSVESLAYLGIVVRPVVVEQTLGLFGAYLLGTRLYGLRPLLDALLSQCPLDDGEDAEQMLDALGGAVYLPRSAYSAAPPVQAVPSMP